jgi:outer membrane protein assembly factor BamB
MRRIAIISFVLMFACPLMAADEKKTPSSASAVVPHLRRVWANQKLKHQSEARGIAQHDGWVYLAGGGAKGRISKLNMKTGNVAWTVKAEESYQPSYPASNGKRVIFGTFYKAALIGLDDQTGQQTWRLPIKAIGFTGGRFDGTRFYIGSDDRHLYAIDWASGKVTWKTKLGYSVQSRPFVYGDHVFVTCHDGKVYALNRLDGEIAWSVDCGGIVRGDPVVHDGLLFTRADTQKYDASYDGKKENKRMLVIDLKTQKIIDTFTAEKKYSRWNNRIVADGNDVFFYNDRSLVAYDTSKRKARWTYTIDRRPEKPDPILVGKTILLPFNETGHHGEAYRTLRILDRKTGKLLSTHARGGTSTMLTTKVIRQGDKVIVAGWNTRAFQLELDKPLPRPLPAWAKTGRGLPAGAMKGLTKKEDIAEALRYLRNEQEEWGIRGAALRVLTRSAYNKEAADAMLMIATRQDWPAHARNLASQGLHKGDKKQMARVVEALLKTAAKEKAQTPEGILQLLNRLGHADAVYAALGAQFDKKWVGFKIQTLDGLSDPKLAADKLWGIAQSLGPMDKKHRIYHEYARIGMAIARRRDKRGIDLMVKQLQVKELPISTKYGDAYTKQVKNAFFEGRRGNYEHLCGLYLLRYFGPKPTNEQELNTNIDALGTWWQKNRDTWKFARTVQKQP